MLEVEFGVRPPPKFRSLNVGVYKRSRCLGSHCSRWKPCQERKWILEKKLAHPEIPICI